MQLLRNEALCSVYLRADKILPTVNIYGNAKARKTMEDRSSSQWTRTAEQRSKVFPVNVGFIPPSMNISNWSQEMKMSWGSVAPLILTYGEITNLRQCTAVNWQQGSKDHLHLFSLISLRDTIQWAKQSTLKRNAQSMNSSATGSRQWSCPWGCWFVTQFSHARTLKASAQQLTGREQGSKVISKETSINEHQ